MLYVSFVGVETDAKIPLKFGMPKKRRENLIFFLKCRISNLTRDEIIPSIFLLIFVLSNFKFY